MRISHSLLSVYGEIDNVVCKADSSDIAETVEEFLPGTTGVGQRGWYGEIQRLATGLPRDPAEDPLTFPSLHTALSNLADAPVEVPVEDDKLSKRDAGKLLYAAMVLRKIGDQIPGRRTPLVGDEHLGACLDRVRPARRRRDATGAFKSLISGIHDRDGWTASMQTAVDQRLVSGPAACFERPCIGSVRKVGGTYATVLTTEFEDPEVSVEKMKNVLDPLNWPRTCSFFRRMVPRGTDQQGWSRVLEEVGTDFCMKTALRYWKGTLPDGGIFVNYDLDDDRTGDDDLVEVDAGYIVVQPLTSGATAAKGVRIHTSKEVRIQGVSPTATAVMACLLGWADIGREMLVSASDLPADELASMTKWSESEPPSNPVPTSAGSNKIPPPRVPPSIRNELITTAAEDFEGYLGRVEHWTGDFISKWQDGLTPDDITELGRNLGHEVTEYWRTAFTRAVETVRPASRETK
jgi:hypothetical protein